MMCVCVYVYIFLFFVVFVVIELNIATGMGTNELFGVDVYLFVFWVCCQLLPLLWLVLT